PSTVTWAEVESMLSEKLDAVTRADAALDGEITCVDIDVEEEPAATTRDVYAYDPEQTDPFIDASDPAFAFESAAPFPVSRWPPASSDAPTPRVVR
ncbi:MAG TPA: hypothetical protein VIF62_37675, partial [Labilithrix sp.]